MATIVGQTVKAAEQTVTPAAAAGQGVAVAVGRKEVQLLALAPAAIAIAIALGTAVQPASAKMAEQSCGTRRAGVGTVRSCLRTGS